MGDPIWLEMLVGLLAGYLVGSVPVGVLVSRVAGVDIRGQGTGNVGAANVRENVGAAAAAVVALGIFLQGLLPTLAAALLFDSEVVDAAAAIGPIIGYGWPVFSGFRGGRGLGVATGAAAGISPLGFIILILCYTAGALLRRPPPAVLAGFVIYAGYVFQATGSTAYRVAAVLLVVLVVVRRLEGVGEDLRHGPALRVLFRLAVFQERPDRGDRADEKGGSAR